MYYEILSLGEKLPDFETWKGMIDIIAYGRKQIIEQSLTQKIQNLVFRHNKNNAYYI